ncbi:MAG: hypothetical protein WAZ48_14180 [Lysobacteraceae bacterium]
MRASTCLVAAISPAVNDTCDWVDYDWVGCDRVTPIASSSEAPAGSTTCAGDDRTYCTYR